MSTGLFGFIESVENNKANAAVCLRGGDAFLESKLQSAYKKHSFELKRFDVTKGLGSEVEAEAFSMSLFGSGVLLWLESKKSIASWTDASKAMFKKILSAADAQSLSVILVLPEDKRIKNPFKELESYSCRLSFLERSQWIARMIKEREANLDKKRQEFLLHFEEPLLVIENWIELWALGGDLWAKTALAWGDPDAENADLGLRGENPAFAWVDAVVSSQNSRAMKLLEHLLAGGSDPIQLNSLLAKTARILASLVSNESTVQFPPFLVKKLQYKSSPKSLELLRKCAKLDVDLKSSSQDARAMLLRLCS